MAVVAVEVQVRQVEAAVVEVILQAHLSVVAQMQRSAGSQLHFARKASFRRRSPVAVRLPESTCLCSKRRAVVFLNLAEHSRPLHRAV